MYSNLEIYDFSYVKTVLRTENLVVIRQKLCRNDVPFLKYGRFSTHSLAKSHSGRKIQYIHEQSYVKIVFKNENLAVVQLKLRQNIVPSLKYCRFPTHSLAKGHSGRESQFIHVWSYVKIVFRTEDLGDLRPKLRQNNVPSFKYGNLLK